MAPHKELAIRCARAEIAESGESLLSVGDSLRALNPNPKLENASEIKSFVIRGCCLLWLNPASLPLRGAN
jgi:hypothetical protein